MNYCYCTKCENESEASKNRAKALAKKESSKDSDSMEQVKDAKLKDIVNYLIINNLQAWESLPESVQDLMLIYPFNFKLVVCNDKIDGLIFKGVQLSYCQSLGLWEFVGIDIDTK